MVLLAGELLVILEFCELGSLHSVLRNLDSAVTVEDTTGEARCSAKACLAVRRNRKAVTADIHPVHNAIRRGQQA